jgi:outer membrane protein
MTTLCRMECNNTIMKQLIILMFVFAGIQVLAQDQASFSISEAEDYGINNNEKMKNAMLDVESARKEVWATTAIGLPQVSAEGSFNNFIDIPVQVVDASFINPNAQEGEVISFQAGQKYSSALTFNVNQLLFDGSYIVGLKFSKFFMKMSENGVERSKAEVKAMVREAYYNVLVAQKNVEVMESILTSTEQLQKETEILFNNGVILKEDADQITLARNQIRNSKLIAERQLEIAKNLLKLQMGYDLKKDIELTQTLDDVLAEVLANSPVNKDYSPKDNSNYQMLSEQRILDGFNLQNEKSKYYPSLGAYFQHSQNAFRNEFNFFEDEQWFPTTVWGIGLNIPITSSGMKVMRVKQAEIKIEKDENNIQNLERTLEFQELQLKAEFQTALDNMNIEKENVELAQFIYSQALKKKSLGAISSLEVTQLQNQLLQAEATYIGSLMNLFSVKIQLDKLFNQ